MEKKKRILVVGSSRGIGKSIALCLAQQGYEICLHGRSDTPSLQDSFNEVQNQSTGTTKLTFDVSNREETKLAIEKSIAEHGPYWGVVLSMGIAQDMPFPGMSDESWDAVINTNLTGFYNVLKPAIFPMIRMRNGGRIVAISSISGIAGNRGQVNYSASKAGLIGASKALARELASRKITVNCVAPGGVETEMIDDKLRTELLKQIPMNRLARPEEVAEAVKYLFCDNAEYMTGQTLVLSGGLL